MPLSPWKQKLLLAYRCEENRIQENRGPKALSFLLKSDFDDFVRDVVPENADMFESWRVNIREIRQKNFCQLTLAWWIIVSRCEEYYFLAWLLKMGNFIQGHYLCSKFIGVNAVVAAGFSKQIQDDIQQRIIETYLFRPLEACRGLRVFPESTLWNERSHAVKGSVTLWKRFYHCSTSQRLDFLDVNGNIFLHNGDVISCQKTYQSIRLISIIDALYIIRDAQNIQILFQGTTSKQSSIYRYFVSGMLGERQVLRLIYKFLVPTLKKSQS